MSLENRLYIIICVIDEIRVLMSLENKLYIIICVIDEIRVLMRK